MKNKPTITLQAYQYLFQTKHNMGNLFKNISGSNLIMIAKNSQFLMILLFAGLVSFAQQATGQTASFTPSTTESCTPSTINFTDNSSGATSWVWDFGNSNISNLQNPSANYPQPGIYTVMILMT